MMGPQIPSKPKNPIIYNWRSNLGSLATKFESKQLSYDYSYISYFYFSILLFQIHTEPNILYANVNDQNIRKNHVRLLIAPNVNQLTDGEEMVECLTTKYSGQFNRCEKSSTPPHFNLRLSESCSIDPKRFLSYSNIKRLLQDLDSAKDM